MSPVAAARAPVAIILARSFATKKGGGGDKIGKEKQSEKVKGGEPTELKTGPWEEEIAGDVWDKDDDTKEEIGLPLIELQRHVFRRKQPLSTLPKFDYIDAGEPSVVEDLADFDDNDEDEVSDAEKKVAKRFRRWQWMSQIYDTWDRKEFPARRLLCRQLLKELYGVKRSYKLRNYWRRAYDFRGGAKIDRFVSLLECRLVVVVMRMRFAPNIQVARQMIRHHMVLINDQVVRWPEHELSPGDRISIDIHQASIIPHVWAYLTYISGGAWYDPVDENDVHHKNMIEYPRHVEVDHNVLAGIYLHHIGLEDMRLPQPHTWGERHEGARRVFKLVFSRFKF